MRVMANLAYLKLLFTYFLLWWHCKGLYFLPCLPRNFGYGSFVCVCNISYCDTLDPVLPVSHGKAVVYTSSKAGERLSRSFMKFQAVAFVEADVEVDRTNTYQSILGFGGAFTDASGINIASLPSSMQKSLIQSYYSKNGLQYTMGRVPIASCDFSTSSYSYDDVPGDFNLTHFKLAREDFLYKIPYIKMAQESSGSQLLLFGSPWSAPAWMKTNNSTVGKGSLKGQPGGTYYQAWADYFVRFLRAYKDANITFWGLTAQNEPTDGLQRKFEFQSMGFTPEMQRDFIKLNLGPTLQSAGYGTDNIKLMIMDDNRILLPKWADKILGDLSAAKYISGIGYHWYLNAVAPARLLDIVQKKYPSVFLLSTEACSAWLPWQLPKVALGSWERAESYAHDIMQDLLHWTVGWIDWNLALDLRGGPNWVQNFVDAPIIVNASAREFYKQPMYYALAHFSKFLLPGSVHIGLSVSKLNTRKLSSIDVIAFQTKANLTVLIAVNRQDEDVSFILRDVQSGYLNITVPLRSFQTYVWSM